MSYCTLQFTVNCCTARLRLVENRLICRENISLFPFVHGPTPHLNFHIFTSSRLVHLLNSYILSLWLFIFSHFLFRLVFSQWLPLTRPPTRIWLSRMINSSCSVTPSPRCPITKKLDLDTVLSCKRVCGLSNVDKSPKSGPIWLVSPSLRSQVGRCQPWFFVRC